MSTTSSNARGRSPEIMTQDAARKIDFDMSTSSPNALITGILNNHISAVSSSDSNPCLAFHSYHNPPRILEANIFRNDLPPEIVSQLLQKFQLLYSLPPSPHTPLPSIPDLETVTAYLLNWCITGELVSSATPPLCFNGQYPSIIGLLTSPALAGMLINQQHIDATIITSFQTFLLATTLQHTRWRDHRPPPQRLTPADLQLISHATGSSLLREYLPSLLAADHSKSTREILQATTVIVLGTILGIIYTPFPHNTLAAWAQQQNQQPSPPTVSPEFVNSSSVTQVSSPHISGGSNGFSVLFPPSGPFQNNPSQWLAAKERLRLDLAHEVIRLAKPLGFIPDAKTELTFKDGLMMRQRWTDGGGQWVWGNVLIPPMTPSPPYRDNGWGREGSEGQSKDKCLYMDAPMGAFHPTPQPVMVGRPEVINPHFPRPTPSGGRKRRSMLLVGPWEGRQMYARMKFVGGSGRPSMMA